MEKKCFKCGVEKEVSSFYKHKAMKDGYLNKCKSCCKKEAKERLDVLSNDTEWIEKERERSRDKYHRLNYRGKYKPSKEKERLRKNKFRSKYPEKARAYNRSSHLKSKIKGNHLHHWNYSEGFEKDVIELSIRDHNLLHRNMIYDQDLMMYRDSKGSLLKTKESHVKLLKTLKQ